MVNVKFMIIIYIGLESGTALFQQPHGSYD